MKRGINSVKDLKGNYFFLMLWRINRFFQSATIKSGNNIFKISDSSNFMKYKTEEIKHCFENYYKKLYS